MNPAIVKPPLRILSLALALLLIVPASGQEKDRPKSGHTYVITSRDSAGTITTMESPTPLSLIHNAPYDTARVERNWSKLKKGLSRREVEDLFGRQRSVEIDPGNAFEYWWYGRRAVLFNSISGKVSQWDK